MSCYNLINLNPKTYATRANALKPVERMAKHLPDSTRVFNVTVLERVEGADVRYFAMIFNVDTKYLAQVIHMAMAESVLVVN